MRALGYASAAALFTGVCLPLPRVTSSRPRRRMQECPLLPPSMSDRLISRRESLKRAAGALALGMGAPAALAAEAEAPSFEYLKLGFYKDAESREPIAWVRLTEEVAEKVMQPDAFSYLKMCCPRASDAPTAFRVEPVAPRDRR